MFLCTLAEEVLPNTTWSTGPARLIEWNVEPEVEKQDESVWNVSVWVAEQYSIALPIRHWVTVIDDPLKHVSRSRATVWFVASYHIQHSFHICLLLVQLQTTTIQAPKWRQKILKPSVDAACKQLWTSLWLSSQKISRYAQEGSRGTEKVP